MSGCLALVRLVLCWNCGVRVFSSGQVSFMLGLWCPGV